LLPSERGALFAVCDAHLRNLVQVFEPEWLIGVGDFAEKRLRSSFAAADIRIGKILHPSPACPASNVDWAGKVTDQLKSLEVWT
jgi:single-strand selective monofunctional uracil DNA glycosylase